NCYAVNRDGVTNLMTAIQRKSIHLIQISTDFIFDGQQSRYTESDNPNPSGDYGKSKWEGEKRMQSFQHTQQTIVRTSLIYGIGEALVKGNIFPWAMEQLRQGKSLTIVDDQFRTPTFVED